MDEEKVIVIDSIMGSGKTSWAIQNMAGQYDENILYIAPLLDETERIKIGCKETRDFKLPQNRGDGKLSNIKTLFGRQDDIASTHQLFKMFDAECKQLIKDGNYVLYIDETVEAVEPYEIPHKDSIDYLSQNKSIEIHKDGRIEWLAGDIDTDFNEIKILSQNRSLYLINDTMAVWQYPAEIFSLFKKVYIMTYLFDGSILKRYFDLNGVAYQIRSIQKENGLYKLVEPFQPDLSAVRNLIHLYSAPDLNDERQKINVLSATWCKDHKPQLKPIKNDIYNFLRNRMKAKTGQIMWSCFSKHRDSLKGSGYGSKECFVEYNCRGTNKHKEKTILVYAVNVYPHTVIDRYFGVHGIVIDKDAYALSTMVQWIWRSAIRDGNEIWIYIPSRRMRNILTNWLLQEPQNT